MELGKHSLGTRDDGKAILGSLAGVERPNCISRQHRRLLFRDKSTNKFDLIAIDLANRRAMVDLRRLDVRLGSRQYVRVRNDLSNHRIYAGCSTKAIRRKC